MSAPTSIEVTAATGAPVGEGELEPGASVILRGLKARPELNGSTGRNVGWLTEKGRYVVQLESGEQIGLKPNNLEVSNPAL